MMTTTAKQITFLVLIDLSALIGLPVSLYGIYKLYQYRHESFVIKRNKPILILSLTCLLLFQLGLYIVGNIFILTEDVTTIGHVGPQLIPFLLICLFGALLPSNWMRLYSNNLAIEISNNKWKNIITGIQSDNWFIKHKDTFGSWKWVITFWMVMLITIYAMLFGFLRLMTEAMTTGKIVETVLLLIPCLILQTILTAILYVIIKKTPFWDDVFHISKDHKFHNKLLIAIIVLSFGSFIHVCIAIMVKAPIIQAAFDASKCLCVGLSNIGCLFIVSSTYWVINNNRANIFRKHHSFVSILDTLNNNDSLEMFAEHLIKEYNIELITSYIEFNQFISYLNEKCSIDLNGHKIAIFSESIPKSQIVIQNNMDFSDDIIKDKAFKLYYKYIMDSSLYQINIPHQQIKEFDNYFGCPQRLMNANISPNDICSLYIACAKEMKHLLNESFSRFNDC
mmetsp:Transcript_78159/g.95705  ORF Transcript_78159/g.95705 Transcript_78159/m.95705 type:complete len:451 (-) Transcript_78159:86-1438(-)